MRKLKWGLIAALVVLAAAFLHYSLPGRDIVRITDTYEKRVTPGANAVFWAASPPGEAATPGRDVFFIQAIRPSGKPIVYRNEDTGLLWPPYLKFDTADLQTRANDLKSTAENPQWVAVRHYGWRSRLLSIYPNALGVRPVAGPDATLIPWTTIVVLILLALLAIRLWRLWSRFHERRIEPFMEDAGEAWDRFDSGTDRLRDRIARWFRR